jgi:hypothetical protein
VGDAATIGRGADRTIVLAVDRDPVTATSNRPAALLAAPAVHHEALAKAVVLLQVAGHLRARYRADLGRCRTMIARASSPMRSAIVLLDAVVAPGTIAYLAIGNPDFQRQSREFTAALKAAGSHPGAISLDRTAGMPNDLAEWV